MDVVCIALGGLGSSFDQLAMNRELLVKHNVRMRGVILNKVNPQKMDMIKVSTDDWLRETTRLGRAHILIRTLGVQDYFSRALKRWDVPLVGCIPELKDLSCPTMADYSKLLKSPMISGEFPYIRIFDLDAGVIFNTLLMIQVVKPTCATSRASGSRSRP